MVYYSKAVPPPTSKLALLAEEASGLPPAQARKRFVELLRQATTEEDRQAIQGYAEALQMDSVRRERRRRMRQAGSKTRKPHRGGKP